MRQNVLNNEYTDRSPCIDCELKDQDKNKCVNNCKRISAYRNRNLPQHETKMDILKFRKILVDELTNLQNGDTSPDIANAIVNVSGKIMATVKLEMEYCKMTGRTPSVDFIETNNKKLLTKK